MVVVGGSMACNVCRYVARTSIGPCVCEEPRGPTGKVFEIVILLGVTVIAVVHLPVCSRR